MNRVALLGGLYSNYLALERALKDIRHRGVDAIYCLGDLGAFGPYPDRVFAPLQEHGVLVVRGNYDDSVGHAREDCQCGYTDPRDNHFAQISYDYTLTHTSPAHRQFLRDLPEARRFELGNRRVLLCHGSPRRMNEFLWESTCSTAFLERLLEEFQADVIAATHTGLKWVRSLSQQRWFVNVGVLGRPENDGTTRVWYTLLESRTGSEVQIEFVPVEYDHRLLAAQMRSEKLPEEFVETILTGWWTTCLEVLPVKERLRGKW